MQNLSLEAIIFLGSSSIHVAQGWSRLMTCKSVADFAYALLDVERYIVNYDNWTSDITSVVNCFGELTHCLQALGNPLEGFWSDVGHVIIFKFFCRFLHDSSRSACNRGLELTKSIKLHLHTPDKEINVNSWQSTDCNQKA